MNQTLLTIDHQYLGWPLQLAWLAIAAAIAAWSARKEGWQKALWNVAPVALIVALGLYFVVPYLEINGINPTDPMGPQIPLGLAIRGYGVFLTLAIVMSVVVVIIRSRQVGLNEDHMLSLCFWMVVVGIAGARLYYVIQKWDEFEFRNVHQFVVSLVDMTKGGLVVYGSLFGAGLVLALSHWRWKLPTRLVLDVVAPAMLVGLSIGRLGCLMNGCCYGGSCSPDFMLRVTFPVGSPVYSDQLAAGRLLGLAAEFDQRSSNEYPVHVQSIDENGLVRRLGLEINPGDRLRIMAPESEYLSAVLFGKIELPLRIVLERETDGSEFSIPVTELPRRSLFVHPVQVYAAVGAMIVAGLLWLTFPYRRFDGQLFAMLLILYPVCRFLEEEVRVDEVGLFGTPFSAGQLTSFVTIGAGFLLFWWLSQRPKLTWHLAK